MVIPLPATGPVSDGPPPPSMAGHIRKLKICVWLLIVAMVTKFVALMVVYVIFNGLIGIFLALSGVLNQFMAVVAGIFLLKDDQTISKMYDFLLEKCNCYQCRDQCGSGMKCLVPFTALNAVNLIFDVINPIYIQDVIGYISGDDGNPSIFSGYDDTSTLAMINWFCKVLLVISIPCCMIGEIGASYVGWKAYAILREESESDGPAGGYRPLASRPPQTQQQPQMQQMPYGQPTAPTRQQQPQTWQAFSGAGQRLGSG